MRIMHVVEAFCGGVFSFLVDVCKELAVENEITVVYSERNETPENFERYFHESVNFIKVDMELKNSIKSISQLKKVLKTEKPQVLHLHSSKAGFVGRIAAKKIKYQGKMFYNPHGLAYLREDINKQTRYLFYIAEKKLAKLNAKIIAVSESEKKEIQKFSSNVISINNGIDIAALDNELNCITNENSKSKNIVVGTVGRITYQKNPTLFKEIASEFPDVSFVWIGDGELRNELESSENIEITGWVNREEVLNKLSNVDIYIQTSLWEGLPISVLEAMYMAKPLIVNEVVGNVDLVDDTNGYKFINQTQAVTQLQSLLIDEDKVKRMGLRSKEILLKNFNFHDTVKNYNRIYLQ